MLEQKINFHRFYVFMNTDLTVFINTKLETKKIEFYNRKKWIKQAKIEYWWALVSMLTWVEQMNTGPMELPHEHVTGLTQLHLQENINKRISRSYW